MEVAHQRGNCFRVGVFKKKSEDQKYFFNVVLYTGLSTNNHLKLQNARSSNEVSSVNPKIFWATLI